MEVLGSRAEGSGDVHSKVCPHLTQDPEAPQVVVEDPGSYQEKQRAWCSELAPARFSGGLVGLGFLDG